MKLHDLAYSEQKVDRRMDAMKRGGGVGGLRFRLTKESHINLRVDYGWGIGGSRGLYPGVTEAF